jgi:hypothetical protein
MSEDGVWDTIFLHQYFFNPIVHAERLRTAYRTHAATVLSRHSGQCPIKEEAETAKCIAQHPILISESTQSRIDGRISAELVDTVRVKGRDEPMRMYAI